MPPRYSYWTIIAGGLPTAFRAADRDELLPTFQRIRERHPDAQMRWFARGKLWSSPEEARAQQNPSNRSRDWRPGGEHRDPRQRFKDAKKARNQDRRQERFERRQRGAASRRPPVEKPHGDPLRRPRARRPLDRGRFGPRPRGQDREEPQGPPRVPAPTREPRPDQSPEPTPPPQPSEPMTIPPGPPERGRKR